MMTLRVLILTCFFLSIVFSGFVFAADDDADDDTEEEEEDEWGDAKLDHELNIPWDYPKEYTKRPLVVSKNVTEFGATYSFMYAEHYFDENGELKKGSFQSKKQVLDLALKIGVTDRLTVKVNFPFVYKKTRITDPDNQNYRLGRSNVYGTLAEDALVDFLDNHEIWKLWEADLPTLGDVNIWSAYSLYQKLDPTTSFTFEFNYKTVTGNDNPRRGKEVRSFLTTGTFDFYGGLGFKQEAWKFSFEGHGGYNYRVKGPTKYSSGTMDLADQVKGSVGVAFQIPEVSPFWDTWAFIGEAHYMQRLWNSRVTDNFGNTKIIEDTPGYSLTVVPKIMMTDLFGWEVPLSEGFFSAEIPVAGQRTFLVQSRSSYLPPWDIEGYEGVGITYNLGLIKRWK